MRVGTFLIIAAALACASFPPSNNGYYPDPLPDSPQQLSRSYRTSNYAVADSPPVIHKIELLVNSHPVFTIEVHASNLFEQAKSILIELKQVIAAAFRQFSMQVPSMWKNDAIGKEPSNFFLFICIFLYFLLQ